MYKSKKEVTHLYFAQSNWFLAAKGKNFFKFNVFQRYIENFDWDKAITSLLQTLGSLVLVSLLFFIVNFVGKRLIRRGFESRKKSNNQHLSENRKATIFTLSQNIFHYAILFFYLYAVLSILGIPVGTLITGAGILSVALGLGAQGFVTDIVTGFFILLEEQFSVGEYVKLGAVQGTIHAIGLRTTQILGYDGTLHFVPNRSITIVSNFSRNDMRALIDIRVDPNKDINQMERIISQVNDRLTPQYSEITIPPQILGTVDPGNGTLVVRVTIYTKNGAQYSIQREFLAAYLAALSEAGFEIPAAPINLE
ncbi:small-conductance mechanosensitive channel [Ligilactobacillus acidipiscis DSM 15836]|uniref:Small-conductance mechanosensitive channel n=1 Tax=Ligilactobacillus acidipiscis DSM 15836 TaxID=1423716 RepID=A0ABR5PLB8_9LACO|nr:small-conductance mechanosensitive channel [Ligilactobacillus acidipiscis DSM 15836]